MLSPRPSDESIDYSKDSDQRPDANAADDHSTKKAPSRSPGRDRTFWEEGSDLGGEIHHLTATHVEGRLEPMKQED